MLLSQIRAGDYLLGDPTIYFDVDNTLVMWGLEDHPNVLSFTFNDSVFKLVPHTEHIQFLKDKKADGFKIVVWSAGSETWAKEVINVLGLSSFVDHAISKPMFHVDDLPSNEILHPHRHIYFPFQK
jgi:FMN phosphatase YigB (HAD superfamily)